MIILYIHSRSFNVAILFFFYIITHQFCIESFIIRTNNSTANLSKIFRQIPGAFYINGTKIRSDFNSDNLDELNHDTEDSVANTSKCNEISDVRVRFAPSPTGLLHLGSLRVFLYNYMFARKMCGRVILRIDDTDVVRSTSDSLDDIITGLKWLGLTWDEGPEAQSNYGPYFQSQRIDIYREYAQKLVDEGKAYYCFCDKDLISQKRSQAIENGISYTYDRSCRKLDKNTISNYLSNNKEYTIRLKSHEDNGRDFIILRSNGMPTYNFSSCVDDSLMNITHVIRGIDHLENTPRQGEILEAMGANIPHYIHCSLLMNPDQSKISKRDGTDLTIVRLRTDGISPTTIINYLLFLGTKYSDDVNLYDINCLINRFSLDFINRAPIVINYDKICWLNKMYINSMSCETFTNELQSYVEYVGNSGTFLSRCIITESFELIKTHIHTFKDYVNIIENITRYNSSVISEHLSKYVGEDITKELIELERKSSNGELHDKVVELISDTSPFNKKIIRILLTGYEIGIPLVDVVHLWKIIENNKLNNFTSLRQRITNLNNLI